MDLKLFKNFTPFVNRASKPLRIEDLKAVEHLPTSDPTGQQWVMGGFAPFNTGEFVIDISGAGFMCVLQINERILPAAVIKEKMVERIAQIEARDQRKANKADYAQVKDEVTGKLLPRAFIKRTLIPILFVKAGDVQYSLVFTSSAKKADDAICALRGSATINKRWEPALLANVVKNDIATAMNDCAKGSVLAAEGDEPDTYLQMGRSAVLKGKDKQRITIKEKDIGSAEVQNLLNSTNYDVIRLAVEFYEGDVEPAAEVSVSDNLVFAGFKAAAVKKTTAEDEADAAADALHNIWIVARTASDMLTTVVAGLGGLREKGKETQQMEPPMGDASDSPAERLFVKSAKEFGVEASWGDLTQDARDFWIEQARAAEANGIYDEPLAADDPAFATEVGSHDASEKNGSGISDAAQSIIDDPLQQTDLDSVFGPVVAVDDDEL